MGSAASAGKPRRLPRQSVAAAVAAGLPVGTVTFLMTDIEGSTRVWDATPEVAKAALGRHDRIVIEHVERNHGLIVESGREGDSFLAVFEQAGNAVSCALDTQRSLQGEVWPAGVELPVRIAVHTGEAEPRSGHYIGAPLYRLARLLATAHGRQILISKATEQLVADSLPEGVSLRDLGQHRLRDLSRPEQVYQLLAPGLAADFPPLKSAQAKRTNLPQELTSFVGRLSEMSALRQLIKECRLVTLTGSGGIGKSRLALRVAAVSAEHWPDGVWWVDLTPIDDPQRVVSTIASGLQLPGASAGQERVYSWLSDKTALLLLDNCEHLIAACADFCQRCLERSAQISIVATSREALGVPGETRYRVTPLNEADALSLFEKRGQLVLSDFKVSASNRNDISQICRQLDQIPLAIELAASRIGMMSAREIRGQLDDRFRLLTAGTGTVPARQRTLTATIEWSYRLLTEAEAALFRRLSVFRGGFTMDAAQAVCGDGLVPDVLAALTGLIQKSMLTVEKLDEGETRYRLLESQAAYAEQKLTSAGELSEMKSRHRDYFLAATRVRTSNARGSGFLTPSDMSWMRQERANLWSALRWARNSTEEGAIGLAVEIGMNDSIDISQKRAWLSDLLEQSPAQGLERMIATRVASLMALRQGDLSEALRLGQAQVQMGRAAGNTVELAHGLRRVGFVLNELGQHAEAQSALDEAVRILDPSGDELHARTLAYVLNDLGTVALSERRFEFARDVFGRSLDLAQQTGNVVQVAAALADLADAELGCGEPEKAERTWKQALSISREFDFLAVVSGCLGGLARAATARQDHQRAISLAAAHDRLDRELSINELSFWREELRLSQEISKAKLGPEKTEAARRKAVAMSLERMIAFALDEPGEEAVESLPLTRRERQVTLLIAAGLKNREIAERLFLSERTVEGHVERIRDKLDLRSRTELATWAIEHGVVEQKE